MRGRVGSRDDARAPGAAVDAVPSGTLESPQIRLTLWPDEPLGTDPAITCYYGSTVEVLPVTHMLAEGYYYADVALDLDDLDFDGSGLFEISLEDSVANAAEYVADFTLGFAAAGEPAHLSLGAAEFHVAGSDVDADQFDLITSCNAVPYEPEGFTWAPLTVLFSMHLAADDVFAAGAGLNTAYADEVLTGVDETSVTLCRWDPAGRIWLAADSSLVGVAANGVSSPAEAGGLYCLFASATSSDETPPSAIDDLTAIPGDGGRQGNGDRVSHLPQHPSRCRAGLSRQRAGGASTRLTPSTIRSSISTPTVRSTSSISRCLPTTSQKAGLRGPIPPARMRRPGCGSATSKATDRRSGASVSASRWPST
ncbi:MAG: hypothetical protein KAY32_00365 [Candidatus Eisenbacteria sp.]|nr:hypothetical protein [Candidatus Eisenbacteria bacterium]